MWPHHSPDRSVAMRSWVFFQGLFYKVMVCSLAISAIAKLVINLAIEPIALGSRMSEWEGRILPYPPGRFAVTHAEHWHDGWPDVSDGVIGKISSILGALIERVVSYDNVETIVFAVIFAIIIWKISLATWGKPSTAAAYVYIGMGLIFAGGISNQGEIALFGHATDFIFIRYSPSGGRIAIANLADVMLLVGFLLLLIGSWYQRYRNRISADESSSPALLPNGK